MEANKQSIILFKGESQYGTLNRFIDEINDAYQEINVPTKCITIKRDFDATRSELIKALKNDKPLFAIGMNGMGQFKINEKSIYDIGEFHNISWLVDHPVYHMGRIETFAKRYGIIAVIDQQHEAFIQAAVPDNPSTVFLPSGGFMAQDTEDCNRDINILFCGTGVSFETLREQWQQFPKNEIDCLEAGIEMGKSNIEIPLMEIVSSIFSEFNLEPNRERFLRFMLNIEQYLRAYNRYSILKSLDDANITVDIFGNNWDWCTFKSHKMHKSVDFETTLSLFKRSKIGLNISTFFTHGAHDRIFSSMLNGAISLTNSSHYLDTLPNFKESSITYSNNDSLIHNTRSILDNSSKMNELAHQGYELAISNHTIKHRAVALREALLSLD